MFGATVECNDESETETLELKIPFARQSLTSTQTGHIYRRMADDRVCLLVADSYNAEEEQTLSDKIAATAFGASEVAGCV